MDIVNTLIWCLVEASALTRKKVRVEYFYENFVEVLFLWNFVSAREKFSCGENCIPRTEMCTLKGASNCSQHYTKCGSVCVDKY